MNKKEIIENIKYIAIGLIAAYLLNFIFGVVLGTDLPIVAVISESMTHDSSTEVNHYNYLMSNYNFTREQIGSWSISNGFLKGDVLIVKGSDIDELKIGDVIVYNIEGQKIPIVHRIVEIDHNRIVTKGDHNKRSDQWIPTTIHGKAIVVIPLLGWPKLLLTELFSRVF